MELTDSRNYLEILGSGAPGAIGQSTLIPALRTYPVTEVRDALAEGIRKRLAGLDGNTGMRALAEKLSGYLSDLVDGKEIRNCYGVQVPAADDTAVAGGV